MKRLIYIVTFALAALVGCDKENSKVPSLEQRIQGEWRGSEISVDAAIYLSIKDELNELMDSVKTLLAESNHLGNEGIKAGKVTTTVGIVGVGMSFAKRFVILSMVAYVVICGAALLPKKKKSEEAQEV